MLKKNEWITLGIGLVLIISIVFGSGMFSNPNKVKNMNGTKIPEVIAKDISTDPKLKILEVSIGTGTPVAVTNKTVAVNYTGMLEDGKVFDSSYTRGSPIEFVLGIGRVIKGWDQGLQGMKPGGKRRLIIAPEYAYGATGYPPSIPGNATLVFDVEMVSVK
jgi:peptidylprolyl isomerase